MWWYVKQPAFSVVHLATKKENLGPNQDIVQSQMGLHCHQREVEDNTHTLCWPHVGSQIPDVFYTWFCGQYDDLF